MGYATLSVGHLNMITVTFAVMILGLGIDLGIQFIARYEEELKKNPAARGRRADDNPPRPDQASSQRE